MSTDEPVATAAQPIPRVDGPKGKPREWVISVCATCGRQANWPFCEHRGNGMDRWTETVVVREVGRGR